MMDWVSRTKNAALTRWGDQLLSKVLIIQHIDCETPGTIAQALGAHHVSSLTVHPYRGDEIPASAED